MPGRSGSEYDWDGVSAKPAAMPTHTKDRLDQMAALDMVFFSLRNQYGNDDGTSCTTGWRTTRMASLVMGMRRRDPRTYPGGDMTSYSSWGEARGRGQPEVVRCPLDAGGRLGSGILADAHCSGGR